MSVGSEDLSMARGFSVDNPGIKGILFDLDGTLIDTYQTILQSLQYAVRKVLHTEIPAKRLMSKVGQPLVDQVADFCDTEEQCNQVLAVYRARNAEVHDELTRGFPGCAEALDSLLEKGFVLGVVTSKMHRPAEDGLKLFNLQDKVSCLVGADDCEHHKPHPEPVCRGAALLGLKPEECVYVGDSPFDIQSGNAAGAITLAALWGMFTAEELQAQNPTYQSSSITKCAEFLRS
ncbi:MAG: HAD family hydrolase [Raoultibacter sp.]|jgi:pyrophosphatase PpaX